MRTIGIDLALTAAHKAVVADAQGHYLTPVFPVQTTPADLERLLERARDGAPDTPLQVVLEPTGMAWFPFAVFFARHAVPTYLVNSQGVADLRRYYQRHAKSDRIDARVLVRLPIVNPDKLHRLHLSSATTLACQRAGAPSYNGYIRWFLGGGEDEGAPEAMTSLPRLFPITPGCGQAGPYRVASTTHHEGGPPTPMEPCCQPFRTGVLMSSAPSHPQLVVGVDIAAASFMAAWAQHGHPPSTPRSFEQSSQGFAAFQKQLAATGVAPEATLVVLEATGSDWGALAVALHSAGYQVAVVNPAHVYNYAKSLPRRGKSDGLDARLLTQFGLERKLETWTPPPAVYHELRQRLIARDGLLTMRGYPAGVWRATNSMPWSSGRSGLPLSTNR